MKKSMLLASLLLIGSTSVMAAKVGEMGISLEVGALNSDAVSRVSGIESNADISTTYEALRFGKYFDFGRLGVAIGLINEDKGTDGKYIGINYDYMFYNDSKFVPFVGVAVAYNSNKWEGSGVNSGINIDHNGMQYGVEAGLVYDLSDKFELEVGARYSKSSVSGDTTIGTTKIEIDVDSSTQYYLSLGYKF